jgi:PhnB protein
MMTRLTPYLHYAGDCAEAFRFYERALGGKINMMSTYGEAPADSHPPGPDHYVMHAELEIDGALLHGSDAPPQWAKPFGGVTIALQYDDVDRGEAAYAALAEGGQATMPMAETFWAHRFGMLVDRFGVPWMVNVSKGK